MMSASPDRDDARDEADEDAPLADDDLGLDAMIEDLGDEGISRLDDKVGVEDDVPLFALELPPAEAADEDEDAEEAIEIEGLDTSEYGWTDTGEDGEDDWDPAELDLPELAPLGRDDGGEEGVDDLVELGGDGGDAVPHLPELSLADHEEDGDEELALGDDGRVGTGSRAEGAPIELPPRFEDGLEVRCYPAPGAALQGCAIDAGLLIGAGLFELPDAPGAVVRRDAAGLEDVAACAIAASRDASVVLVGAESGVWVSLDGGASFSKGLPAHEGEPRVVRELADDRFWVRAAPGEVCRMDAAGEFSGALLFEPTVELAAPRAGGVLALCVDAEGAVRLVGSADGGERWAAVDGPNLSPTVEGARWTLAVEGNSIAIGSTSDPRGPFLSTDGGRGWSRVPGVGPTGAMALVREGVGRSLYAAHPIENGEVVVRHRPSGGEPGVVLDVAAELAARGLPHDPRARTVRAIEARPGEPSRVLVVTMGAVFEVRVDPDEVG